MNVKQFKHLILEMMKYNYDEDRGDGIVFCPIDGDDLYTANRIYEDIDGKVIIDHEQSSSSVLDIKQIDRQLSNFGKDAEILFQISDSGDFRCFEITDSWDAEYEYLIVNVNFQEEFCEEIDFTEAGDQDTATVGQLVAAIIEYGELSKHLFAFGSHHFETATVDYVNTKNGKVVLHSSQSDARSLTLESILRSLKGLDRHTDVQFMHCDDNCHITRYNVTGYYVEEGKMYLEINEV